MKRFDALADDPHFGPTSHPGVIPHKRGTSPVKGAIGSALAAAGEVAGKAKGKIKHK